MHDCRHFVYEFMCIATAAAMSSDRSVEKLKTIYKLGY